jgi:ABC-2 type transport system ATP-binding protein
LNGTRIDKNLLQNYKSRVSFLPQLFDTYPECSGEDLLHYWAIEFGISVNDRKFRINSALESVGLEHAGKQKAKEYSGGMLKRLGIAVCLLREPSLLILDEPTTGLDIESRERLRKVLVALATKRIIILSTHIASDIEAIANQLLVLNKGEITFQGTPAELIQHASGRVFETVIQDKELTEFTRLYRITGRVRILQGIRIRGVAHTNFNLPGELVKPNLEEAYLAHLNFQNISRTISEQRMI